MKVTPRTESEAKAISQRTLLKPGWHKARITIAVQRESSRGNDMIELQVGLTDERGGERYLLDWLSDAKLFAAKLKHAAESVGAAERYESGEIDASDFDNKEVMVNIDVEKKGRQPGRNVIIDYASIDAKKAIR